MKKGMKKLLYGSLALTAAISLVGCKSKNGSKNNNGGESSEVSGKYTVTYVTAHGEVSSAKANSLTAKNMPSLTADGYVFEGWYTDAEFTTVAMPGELKGDVTLYAKWSGNGPVVETKYTVTFNANGHGTAPQAVADVTEVTAAMLAQTMTETGFTFGGWYTDAACQTAATAGTITSNVTLYAKWDTEKFTVKFNTMQGSAIEDQLVELNGKATAPTDPTKTGYIFRGFYEDQQFSKKYDFNTAVTGNIELYAKWEVESYTVSFVGATIDSQTVEYGLTASQPNAPEKTGYRFVGYFADENMQTAFDFSAAITGTTTIYVKYDINKYEVTYNTNGGTEVEKALVEHGSKAVNATTTKTGSQFAGWYTDVDLSIEYNFNSEVTAAVTLYAKWDLDDVSVVFNTLGGSEIASTTVKYGNKLTEMPANPTKNGYAFKGWFTDENCSVAFNAQTEITSTLNLYAKWEEAAVVATYNTQGGSTVEDASLHEGDKVPQPADPTKTGYKFEGWFTEAECQNEYDFNTVVTANITIYAKWSIEKYDLVFMDGETTVSSEKLDYNSAIVKPETNPSKIGYDFVGWFTAETEGTQFVFTDAKLTENTTLYARYDVSKVTIKYVSNGAGAIEDDVINYGTTLTQPEASIIGKHLVGWYTAEACAEADKFDFDTALTADLTLYAKWDDNVYDVTFVATNATEETIPAKQEVIHNGKAVRPESNPEKVGYVFRGWYADSTYETVFDFANTVITQATTIYAKFDTIYEELTQRGDKIAFNVDFNDYTETSQLVSWDGTWGTKGVYSFVNHKDNDSYGEYKIVLGNGKATMVDTGTGGIQLITDFGQVYSGTIEGYADCTLVNQKASWTFFQIFGTNDVQTNDEVFALRIATNGGKNYIEYRVNNGYTNHDAASNSKPKTDENTAAAPLNAIEAKDATYNIYYKINLEAGTITMYINGIKFVENLDINLLAVTGARFVSSDGIVSKKGSSDDEKYIDTKAATEIVDNVIVVNTPAELSVYSARMIAMLDEVYATYDLTNYTINGTALTEAYNQAKTDMQSATTEADIKAKYDTAIAAMKEFKNDLAQTKANKVADVTGYLADEVAALDAEANAATISAISTLKTNATTDINAATTAEDATKIADSAKKSIKFEYDAVTANTADFIIAVKAEFKSYVFGDSEVTADALVAKYELNTTVDSDVATNLLATYNTQVTNIEGAADNAAVLAAYEAGKTAVDVAIVINQALTAIEQYKTQEFAKFTVVGDITALESEKYAEVTTAVDNVKASTTTAAVATNLQTAQTKFDAFITAVKNHMFTITVKTKDSAVTDKTISVKYDETVGDKRVKADNLVMVGLYNDENCTEAYDTTTKIYANATVYAKWADGELAQIASTNTYTSSTLYTDASAISGLLSSGAIVSGKTFTTGQITFAAGMKFYTDRVQNGGSSQSSADKIRTITFTLTETSTIKFVQSSSGSQAGKKATLYDVNDNSVYSCTATSTDGTVFTTDTLAAGTYVMKFDGNFAFKSISINKVETIIYTGLSVTLNSSVASYTNAATGFDITSAKLSVAGKEEQVTIENPSQLEYTIYDSSNNKVGNSFSSITATGAYKVVFKYGEFTYSEAISFNAEVVVTHTLSFVTNVDGVNVSNISVGDAEAITLPNNPTATDLSFVGWYTDAALTQEFNASAGVTTDTTLYAKWYDTSVSTGSMTSYVLNSGSIEGVEILTSATYEKSTKTFTDPNGSSVSAGRYKTNGTTSLTGYGFKISVSGPCTIIAYAMSGSSKTDRYVVVIEADGTKHTATENAGTSSPTSHEFTITKAGSYVIGSNNSGINFYGIYVKYAGENDVIKDVNATVKGENGKVVVSDVKLIKTDDTTKTITSGYKVYIDGSSTKYDNSLLSAGEHTVTIEYGTFTTKTYSVTVPQISTDTTITFGTSGNYATVSGMSYTANIGGTNTNNSQVKEGDVSLYVAAGAKVKVYGYGGSAGTKNNDHTSYTVTANGATSDAQTGDYEVVVTSAGLVVITPTTTDNYLMKIEVTYPISNDTTITFGTSGNYTTSSGITYSGSIADNGGDNTQISNGKISVYVAAGAKVKVYGYGGSIRNNAGDYTSYTVTANGITSDTQTGDYEVIASSTQVVEVACGANNYLYKIEVTYPISTDTTITFGTEGNYSTSKLIGISNASGSNPNNSQISNSVAIYVAAGAKVKVYGYGGSAGTNNKDYTSYTVTANGDTSAEQDADYEVTVTESGLVTITTVEGNNYLVKIEVTFAD